MYQRNDWYQNIMKIVNTRVYVATAKIAILSQHPRGPRNAITEISYKILTI